MKDMHYLHHQSSDTMASKVTNPSEENLIGRHFIRQEIFISEKEYRSARTWKFICIVLSLFCLLTISAFPILFYFKEINLNSKAATEDVSCQNSALIDKATLYNGPMNVFSELTESEIDSIVQFLFNQKYLNLVDAKKASINSNFIHLVEMLLPPKKDVLEYLAGNRDKPTRMARVYMFRGNSSNPMVEEYKVGPLPNPTHFSIIKTSARKTEIPFFMRPFTKYEFKAVYKHILPTVLNKAHYILKESYNATMHNCGKQCLKFTTTPISSGFLEKGKRKCWFWFTHDIEFYTLHPLDFQFLVDMSHPNPKQWKVERVFYANKLYKDLDDLKEQYDKGNITKTKIAFPTIPIEEQYSAVYRRGNPFPEKNLPPPQQVQPAGPRYSMSGNELEYMDWDFNVRMTPSAGMQLYNIRYKGKRIVYELSMQEIGVLYSGHSPSASMLYFADSAGLFGTRTRGMMPGVDCPEHGTLLNSLSFTSVAMGKLESENSICIFEHASERILRRHRAYGMSGASYSALQDYSLVVRMFICIINYDYVFDFVFHNNGAIEVRVSSTGYLASSFYYPQELPFGTRISEHVIAGLHHHLFHFKADIDIQGTENRYHTKSIIVTNKTNQWADDPVRQHVQNIIIEKDIETEIEASREYDFNSPKYLLFTNNKKSELGNRPAYRIINRGVTKMQLPRGVGFEPSMTWGHYQVSVTKQKDDEISSSSMFAMWDAQDPVVKFDNFIDDNDNILDQDLVAWLTLGMYHIPHTENVPNTGTIGTTQSFFLTPFNYFHEDPSIASRDGVRVMPIDPKNPLNGATVDRHNTTLYYSCKSREIDSYLLKNSTFIFS